ncbi:MAG: type IV pilus modification PilV family protein [Planctomycetota bacterium]|jgi:prepilin-type N-terminal cleavage/methylation domain-containing protein
MSISNRPIAKRSNAGFTLLEIMVTLAVVGLAILPVLTVREDSAHMAYRSSRMMQALTYAERLLAERMTDPEVLKDRVGFIEDDPAFRYEISIEDFDLATGRVEEEDDDPNSPYSINSPFAPADAGVPPGMEDEEEMNDPNLVRRVKLTIFYPGLDEELEEKVVLEGYIPRATEKDPGSLLDGNR